MRKLLVGALIALFGLLGAGALHHHSRPSVSRADMYAPHDMYSPQDMY